MVPDSGHQLPLVDQSRRWTLEHFGRVGFCQVSSVFVYIEQYYPGILLNSRSSDQNASAYIRAPSRNGAPGSSIGALSDVK